MMLPDPFREFHQQHIQRELFLSKFWQMSRGICPSHVNFDHRRPYLNDIGQLECWKKLKQFLSRAKPLWSKELEKIGELELSVERPKISPEELGNRIVCLWRKHFVPHLVPNNETLRGDLISGFLEVVIESYPEIVLSVVDRIDEKSDLCHANDGSLASLLAKHVLAFPYNAGSCYHGERDPNIQSKEAEVRDVVSIERKFLKQLLSTSVEKSVPFVENIFEVLRGDDAVMALWLFLVHFFHEMDLGDSHQRTLLCDLWTRAGLRVDDVMRVILMRRHILPELWDFLHPLMVAAVGSEVWEQTWTKDGNSDAYSDLSKPRLREQTWTEDGNSDAYSDLSKPRLREQTWIERKKLTKGRRLGWGGGILGCFGRGTGGKKVETFRSDFLDLD